MEAHAEQQNVHMPFESIRYKHNLSQMYLDMKGNKSKGIQGFQEITYSSIEIRKLDKFNVQRNETGRGTYRKQNAEQWDACAESLRCKQEL